MANTSQLFHRVFSRALNNIYTRPNIYPRPGNTRNFFTSSTHFNTTLGTSSILRLDLLPKRTAASSRVFSNALSRPHRSRIMEFLESRMWQATHRDSRIRTSPAPVPWHRLQRTSNRRQGLPWLENIPGSGIFWGILVLNGIVYLMWTAAAANFVRILLFLGRRAWWENLTYLW